MTRERRDDLRDVLLAHNHAKQAHYPQLVYSSDGDERARQWHAAATPGRPWLRGMEEAVRDIRHSIEAWSPEAKATFYAEVLATTGRSFFAISEDASKAVARLLRRKRQRFRADELLLLRDYVSDYPDGELVAAASEVLRRVEG